MIKPEAPWGDDRSTHEPGAEDVELLAVVPEAEPGMVVAAMALVTGGLLANAVVPPRRSL